jgi:glycosyltransferase involved in cell wall biosynthesis
MSRAPGLNLLLFNLATDDEDPILGFTTAWIQAFARECESVDVITMAAGKSRLPDNVRVFSVGKEKGYSETRRGLEFYRILLRLLGSRRYDASFAHMIPWFAILAAPALRVRRIRSFLWYAHGAAPWTLRVAEKLVDTILSPTRASFPLASPKLRVVGHGIDTERFKPAKVDRAQGPAFRIGCVGRLSPSKGVMDVLEAVHFVVHAHGRSGVRLRLVGPILSGNSAYASQLAEAVEQADLKHVVEFAGPRPHGEIVSEYQQMELLVSASRTGSADKVVLEAMACAVPVLTSNPAFASVLAPWPECLTKEGDAPEMGRRILQFMGMPPDERQGLGRALRSCVVAEHSLDRLARKLTQELFPVQE